MPRKARLAALACAPFVAVAAAGATNTVSIEAPDGSLFAMPISSGNSFRPLPGGGVEAIHSDAFLREDQLPLVLTRTGESVRFHLDREPTSVAIAYTGHAPVQVRPTREVVWRVPVAGKYHVSVTVRHDGEGGAWSTTNYIARIAAPPTRPAAALLTTRRGRFALEPEVVTWVAPSSEDSGSKDPSAPSAGETRARPLPGGVRLVRGERVTIALGFEPADVRGSGFGSGELALTDADMGRLTWRLGARRSGIATLRVTDRRGGYLKYSFRFSVSPAKR